MFANIAAYKFVTLTDLDDPDEPEAVRAMLHEHCLRLGLKGTILVATEGVNLFLAGKKESVEDFLTALRSDTRFVDIEPKWSWSSYVPFKRLRVKVKKEIVTSRMKGIDPANAPAPQLSAAELKRWYEEGRDFVIVDTRNDWEYAEGTFKNAINPQLNNFSEFANLDSLDDLKDKTVVTFCTGGIRCEKAAPFLKLKGFKNVVQLQGGILKYFEECGGAHWEGNCVVFDDRGAVDPQLMPVKEAPQTENPPQISKTKKPRPARSAVPK